MNDYQAGNVLRVRFHPYTDSSVGDPDVRGQDDLSLMIVEPFTPFTMSAVMHVKLISTTGDKAIFGGRTSFVLKLYDRRAVRNVRNDWRDGKPYDPEQEANYQAYLTNPLRAPVKYRKYSPPDAEDELAKSALFEEWLGRECHKWYIDELSVYRNLMKAPTSQGVVPQFFGHVQLDSPIGTLSGILIEHVGPSITLKEFVRSRGSCGRFDSQLASVFDMAISTLEPCHDAQVINWDVRPWNVLVRLSSPWRSDGAFDDPNCAQPLGCVLIDFGSARTRQPTETDEEWARLKEKHTEEKVLAQYMSSFFEQARVNECEAHRSTCRPETATVQAQDYGTVSTPFWSYKYHDRFQQVYTEEQRELMRMCPFWPTTIDRTRKHWQTSIPSNSHNISRVVPAPVSSRGVPDWHLPSVSPPWRLRAYLSKSLTPQTESNHALAIPHLASTSESYRAIVGLVTVSLTRGFPDVSDTSLYQVAPMHTLRRPCGVSGLSLVGVHSQRQLRFNAFANY